MQPPRTKEDNAKRPLRKQPAAPRLPRGGSYDATDGTFIDFGYVAPDSSPTPCDSAPASTETQSCSE